MGQPPAGLIIIIIIIIYMLTSNRQPDVGSQFPCAARYCKRKAKAKSCSSDWIFIYSAAASHRTSKDR